MALIDKLNAIEGKLQRIIEGSANKLTSSPDFSLQLSHKLVTAMGDESRQEGELTLAPNHYTIILSPGDAAELKNNSVLLDELTSALIEASEEAGITFPSTPEIHVIEDRDLPEGDVEIVARTVYTAATATKNLAPPESSKESVPPNAFLIIAGHKVFQLDQMVVNIGRRPDNNLVIDDPSVSRVHAQLRAIRGQFVLFDLESTGGTFINGQRVSNGILYPGDVIALANIQLVYGQDAPRSLDDTPGYTRPSPVDQRKTITNSSRSDLEGSS
ncbi:MAG: FhaA domain-containing protein [Anaerolineales bacterium]|nr:FhaA domain-containing protein [Anaerolineales bacterium]